MSIINKPITGQEDQSELATPCSALVNFYHAFNDKNHNLMSSNWLQNNEASMSNPLGGVKRSWKEISDVYKKIFNGKADVYVEFYDYSIHESEGMFIAVGRERGSLEINGTKIELAIRTSRIYVLDDMQWKQLHHHGSMDNPELLATYQSTLLN